MPIPAILLNGIANSLKVKGKDSSPLGCEGSVNDYLLKIIEGLFVWATALLIAENQLFLFQRIEYLLIE